MHRLLLAKRQLQLHVVKTVVKTPLPAAAKVSAQSLALPRRKWVILVSLSWHPESLQD